jgi:hypothetical protein
MVEPIRREGGLEHVKAFPIRSYSGRHLNVCDLEMYNGAVHPLGLYLLGLCSWGTIFMIISVRHFLISTRRCYGIHGCSSGEIRRTSPTRNLLGKNWEDLRGIFTIEDNGLNWISRREEGRKCSWTLGIGNDEVMRVYRTLQVWRANSPKG